MSQFPVIRAFLYILQIKFHYHIINQKAMFLAFEKILLSHKHKFSVRAFGKVEFKKKIFEKFHKFLTTLIFGFTSIDDDSDFELFSKKLKLLTTLVFDFASFDEDIDFEFFRKSKNVDFFDFELFSKSKKC
jgi:hypothetical protein